MSEIEIFVEVSSLGSDRGIIEATTEALAIGRWNESKKVIWY